MRRDSRPRLSAGRSPAALECKDGQTKTRASCARLDSRERLSLRKIPMKRPLALAVFILSAFVLANAQESASTAHASSIAGTVVKEPGSQPLKKVLVQVVAENQKEGGNYTASTDADGHFRIENVLPGRYRIFIERTGFVAVNEHGLKSDVNVFTVQAGQAVEDLLFRMLLTAVISGRITDEDGDPMSGVRVVAQKKKPGKSTRESVGTEATNDLGEYRVAGLFPGQYWMVAMPPPDFRDYEKQEKASAGEGEPDTRYVNTYYPGTYDAMLASSVTLKAGDEMPVNFTLVPARTYRVRGIITGVTAAQKPSVELFSKAGDSYRANANEVGPDGRFEVRGVAPGSYVVRASTPTESQSFTAHQNVSVVAADVDADVQRFAGRPGAARELSVLVFPVSDGQSVPGDGRGSAAIPGEPAGGSRPAPSGRGPG